MIGLIGIGNIGMAVAEALLRASYCVVGFSKTNMPAFAALGGTAAASPMAVAQSAAIILCCLPDEDAARDVYEGESNIISGLGAGTIVIDLASYSLGFKEDLATKISAAGGTLLDGEVTGDPDMLRLRTGVIYLSGDEHACRLCLPICRAIVPEIFVLGPYGSSSKMKLVNNLLVAIHTTAAAEAMALGVKAGFAPELLASILTLSSGSSRALTSRIPLMVARQFYESSGPLKSNGPLKLFSKYLHYIADLAKAADSATPLFNAASRIYEEALHQGFDSGDMSIVYEIISARGCDAAVVQ